MVSYVKGLDFTILLSFGGISSLSIVLRIFLTL